MTEAAASKAREPTTRAKSRKTDQNAPIRKRRKRTVVSGAPDDCFTCSKRGARCDRRRPYCSQCLELGRECSGYKTTLTWGVGVASRGKLRGQKVPVMESTEETSSARSQSQKQQSESSSRQPQTPQASVPPPASAPPIGAGFLPVNPPAMESMDADMRRQSAFSNASGSSQGMSWSMDMPDPLSWVNGSPNNPPPQILGLPVRPGLHLPTRPHVGHRSSPSVSEASLNYSFGYVPDSQQSSPVSVWQTPRNQPSQRITPPGADVDEEYENVDRDTQVSWTASHSPSYSQLLLARSTGRTPRLRYLISYYAEVIAPMIVAFDSPSNPFRTHVLRLANESEALQEAIATLATSNLRQRRERKHFSTERTLPARLSSMAHRALTDEAFQDRYGISVTEGYAREENHHRAVAVKALNADLADPRRRLSDSVLATLLILCLFHGCDTGVAEFRTQFAGVTRLLAIRMRHSSVVSEELKWFMRMFSWLDTLTATTNNRDVQLRGKCLEISSVSDGHWGLENLAGCDGRLFKMISQLGRLNLLSQDQQPSESTPADVTIPTASLPPAMLFPGWNHVPNASASWSVPGDDYSFSLPSPPQSSDQGRRPSSPAFWAEWHSLRQRLESWRFDPPTSTPIPSPPPSATNTTWPSPNFALDPTPEVEYYVAPENLQDVYQISECFRHAALLYCERLAEPSLPSEHPRIQHLVHLAMHCLCAVQSDVYLLWPLFIVGSECVQENHRKAIRDRCRDISGDSGFVNNISCLELLEKIWEEHSEASSYPVYPSEFGTPPVLDGKTQAITPQAFRWSRVMEAKRGDGEYMVA
ncbi:hypothetical protein N7468_001602 [Penicillium chermesinum]|uniref:Zn(2)-C6 fungal-type domain-containing protein n=1 Tax=Penicillium chermesinum TaxID=63820 RepID=A0A9W9PGV1_9EURO|nr:uncharacterized protein N7468_001602 [Penicillium chermesinum]KAJ5246619.1 hypothetical protein N7468_001602 [Penicillium chermesinum]